ncbi:hypothetical protein HD554DRAFT_2260309 [Boletus coccyginus]|nr:hypothetical protein HD554DRAFT_2260309 [Boletus coccyginus]
MLPAAPRSLLLYSFTSETGGRPHSHLLVGLVDGSLATFPFQNGTLGDQKLISVGMRLSATFTPDAEAYPSSVILATPDALVTGAVANFDKLHIRLPKLGNICCFLYAFNTCLDWAGRKISLQGTSIQSYISQNEFEVDQGDEVTSLHTFTTNLLGAPTSFLCAGVTSYNDGEREPSRGKLLLLQANGPRASLVVMASVSVGGCVYTITSTQNMVLAAVNSSVGMVIVVYKIDGMEKQVWMTQATLFNHNYLITTLSNYNLTTSVLTSHDVSVDLPIVPKQLFLTPTGQIGVVIDMTDEVLLQLTALQRNLLMFYERETGLDHSKYRALKNVSAGRSDLEANSFGFLAGDFLELFLQYMTDEQSLKQIMEGASGPTSAGGHCGSGWIDAGYRHRVPTGKEVKTRGWFTDCMPSTLLGHQILEGRTHQGYGKDDDHNIPMRER